MLNSTGTAKAVAFENLKIELLTNRNYKKFEKNATIEYKIDGTDIKMKLELNFLDNYEQYIFGFIESYRETIKLDNWSSDTSYLVLKSLLSDIIRREHKDLIDKESIFSALLKTNYTKQYLPRLCLYLQSIKPKNFENINDYCSNINDAIKRNRIHNLYTKEELSRKFNEAFMNVLLNELILKYSELVIYDAETIIKKSS
ncbi:hypothetical protein DMUE_0740 [Dictyocoela muelleri]|nr:hypothetical protein DMUE_0740 [Dictyocoela muelleri]